MTALQQLGSTVKCLGAVMPWVDKPKVQSMVKGVA